MKKLHFSFLTLIVLSFFNLSCQKDDSSIIGSWETVDLVLKDFKDGVFVSEEIVEKGYQYFVAIDFLEGGTGVQYSYRWLVDPEFLEGDNGLDIVAIPMNWSMQGNKLQIFYSDQIDRPMLELDVVIDRDKMTLTKYDEWDSSEYEEYSGWVTHCVYHMRKK